MLTKAQIIIGLIGIFLVAYLTLNELVSQKIGGILWITILSIQLIFRVYNFKKSYFRK
ncbi:hypothetical protein CAR_c16200 [Carnobacterium sp. 17-4]|uniref:hypothetical protein n=1 Tax=Carnobacterium sp. (strain 17-4) TaxID=208596 RepID=UPI0002058FAE|nr:hypothetical protein [Carnobacterium sp. 17-4]AEB30278.1 hypothetical protein CAR_c16200 [Carnobacterium sp. 17-4]